MALRVFMNEARAGVHMSGLEVFPSVEALTKDLEAIDVANGEFRCFTSDGNAVELSIVRNDSNPTAIELAGVSARVIGAPEQLVDYQQIVYEYLVYLRSRHGISLPAKISPKIELALLAALIPDEFVRSS